MATSYNLIQRGELQGRLSRSLRINELAPAPTLAPEMQAVVLVEDLSKPTIFEAGVSQACSGSYGLIAAAAQFAHIQLRNIAGSGIVAVVEEILVTVDTADQVYGISLTTSLLNGAATEQFVDQRVTGVPATQIRFENRAAALTAPQYFWARPAIGIPVSFRVPLILDEGRGLCVVAVSAATDLFVTFHWREVRKPPQ